MKRRFVLIGASFVVLALVGAGVSFGRSSERKTLDAAARAGVPGRFVQLRDGVTQYDLSGPAAGRPIVLLSGATVPYYMWDSTTAALAANGFRVLRYNYYGRGFSDRPKLAYDLATYDRQLGELLDTLAIRGPVDIAGISMGGVIATNFANRHLERVRSLTLVDPAFSSMSRTPLPLRIPGVGTFVAMTIIGPGMARGQLSDFLHPERFPDWTTRYEVQMQYKGFLRSILETFRGDVFKRAPGSFTALAQSRLPILILWGRADRTVPFTRSDTVRAAFPRADFHAIDGAAHLPQLEQPALVDSVLVAFLRVH
jgi:pimeloyl-ACP methyl ester carboxylesterase